MPIFCALRTQLLSLSALGLFLATPVALAIEHKAKVNQLGYLPQASKVAIISARAGTTSLPTTVYLYRASDRALVATLPVQFWNDGAVHAQSGDVGGAVNFSGITAVGTYYIGDVAGAALSPNFLIGPNVYTGALKSAIKSYFYQRLGQHKGYPHVTDSKYQDGAAYLKHNQDSFATDASSYAAMESAQTKKDLRGGWMDAGDVNKYASFAAMSVITLLDGYRKAPWAYDDAGNIPESNNGVADLLDEVRWEIDYIKRTQDATGTNGFISRVGLFRGNADASTITARKPGLDSNPRHYVGECPYATISGTAALAAAANVYRTAVDHLFYSQDLLERANRGWNRYVALVNSPAGYDEGCDGDNVVLSGAGKLDKDWQLRMAIVAAVNLYEAFQASDPIKAATFKSYVESNYDGVMVGAAANGKLSFYRDIMEGALLRYTTLPGITPAAKSSIVSKLQTRLGNEVKDPASDLYRSPIIDMYYVSVGASYYHLKHAITSLNLRDTGLTTIGSTPLKDLAQQHLNWVHGANPLSVAMVTKGDVTGFTQSVPSIYHTWFGGLGQNCTSPANDGTCLAPPTVFLVPGPCANTVCPASSEPLQRRFDPDQRNWHMHEPSINSQAAYVSLLGRLSAGAVVSTPAAPTNVSAVNPQPSGLFLGWTGSQSDVAYNVYASAGGAPEKLLLLNVRRASGSVKLTGLACNMQHTFRVQAVDAFGNVSGSASGSGSTGTCPGAAAAVTGLTVQSNTDTEADIYWTLPSSNTRGYLEVIRNGQSVAQLSSTATTYKVTGLACGKSNSVQIKTVQTDGKQNALASMAVQTKPCAAAQIFMSQKPEFFWHVYGASAPPLSWDTLEGNVEAGGSVMFDRWMNGNRPLMLSIDGVTPTKSTPPTYWSKAKLVLDISVTKAESLPDTNIGVMPVLHFSKGANLVARSPGTPSSVPLGSGYTTLTYSLGSLIGAGDSFDGLNQIEIKLPNSKGHVRIRNMRIEH